MPLATVLGQLTGVPSVFVRKEAKRYGTCRLAEGTDVSGCRVTLIEDVITTGGAVRNAAIGLRKLGARVEVVVCAIDRSADGAHPLADVDLVLRHVLTRRIWTRCRPLSRRWRYQTDGRQGQSDCLGVTRAFALFATSGLAPTATLSDERAAIETGGSIWSSLNGRPGVRWPVEDRDADDPDAALQVIRLSTGRDDQHRHTVMHLPYFRAWVRLGSIRRDK